MDLQINNNELLDDLQTLATYSTTVAPSVTRIVFSPEDMAARAWLKRRCAAAGLLVREDAIGNTFFRWMGEDPTLPAVATGSHMDAIPNAGRYDGTVGVVGGLEAIRALQRAGFRPHRSIELVLFTSEEPTRFGIGCIGSRLMSGALAPARAREFKDTDGLSIDEVSTAAGFRGAIEEVLLPVGHYSAFVELHIEQGPELERENLPIGIVTSIAAPAGIAIEIEGEGGHAGAMLMPTRKDALTAASEIILAVEHAARSSGSVDTVATVGVCKIFPGAVNSVPSQVHLEVDVRDTSLERRDHVLQSIVETCAAVAANRQLSVAHKLLNADPPATAAPHILKAIGVACMELGVRFLPMVSRAYHDSLFLSRIAPTAMIFIPCRGGVSHRPDEYCSPEALSTGVLVLAQTLAALAQPGS